jgi:acyl-CoA synthetase
VESLPEHLVVLDEIPRASGGKIAKGQLRREIAQRFAPKDGSESP